jgi:predicted heme/steroid binding protein/uncharacterized membrane protein
MKNFSPEELAQADGTHDSPTLVAINGKVYDVSTSRKWIGGKHMNRHSAGKDLSSEILAAPHDTAVLERFEIVGSYEEAPTEPIIGIKGEVDAWLQNHPFFRRHPHPAVVHVPIGLMVALPVFEIAALATGSTATEWAAYLCLILGLVALPGAIATGYFTWWINYDWKDSPIIYRKRRLALTAIVLALFAVIWRFLLVKDPVMWTDLPVMIYCGTTLALGSIVSWIGFLGGTLTFPYEKE